MDCLAAFIAGFLIYVYILYISGPHLSKIVGNVGGGAFLADAGLHLFVYGGDWRSSEFVIIGSMMQLVPVALLPLRFVMRQMEIIFQVLCG